ncbi:hypothetical protein [Arenibacter certesii]|uniref:Uncharacterized protein n=1 Tax=Arenibacter certesii TaxID=228955 RepID=A0A918MRG6_9FLAO|nr:hypothetical protein [Arenibacter certesii]GGW49786.1 hypothetical protein GCM10007383_37110 [Arenibacter certesii]
MENLELKSNISRGIKSLISESCSKEEVSRKSQDLHEMIIKKYYNAVDISIDYHRKRIFMDIVVDDSNYDANQLNFSTPFMRTNMYYDNLEQFLISCLDRDNRSISFYAKLLRIYSINNPKKICIS